MTDNELDKESFLQQVHCINTWVFSFFWKIHLQECMHFCSGISGIFQGTRSSIWDTYRKIKCAQILLLLLLSFCKLFFQNQQYENDLYNDSFNCTHLTKNFATGFSFPFSFASTYSRRRRIICTMAMIKAPKARDPKWYLAKRNQPISL